MGAFLSAVAAMKATNFAERLLWLTPALLMPVQHAFVGRELHYRPLLLAVALAIVTAGLYSIRKETLVLAALIPFFAIPASKLVVNYPRIETTDLRAVADWARTSTPEPSLFLFPDSKTSLDPGIFRARSLRGLYVDWKIIWRSSKLFFPASPREWWTNRWVATGSGRWSVTASDFSSLKGVDFVVMKKPIPGVGPVFQNAGYAVYATTSH